MSISTSQAVKSVVNFVNTRFKDLRYPVLFEGFYDINRDFEPQYQQYYAKVKDEIKLKPHISLMYSYDPPDNANSFQKRKFSAKRKVTESAYFLTEVSYVTTSLLFTIVTNNSNYVDSLAEDLVVSFGRDFKASYSDLIHYPWTKETDITIGLIRRPSKFNNKLYVCMSGGTTSDREPTWPTSVNATVEDGTVVWKCINPQQLNVRAYNFVKAGYTQSQPQGEGLRYKLEFGCDLFFPVVASDAVIHNADGTIVGGGLSGIPNSLMPAINYTTMEILSYTDTIDDAVLLDTIDLSNTNT